MIEIHLNDLVFGISYALDYVEKEFACVTEYHSKRVAYIAIKLGQVMGCSDKKLLDLAAAAALHDNALSEYQQIFQKDGKELTKEVIMNSLGDHCKYGERNISELPFYKSVKGAILYHHETADGTGPFGKHANEVPAFARIIHIADTIDARFDLSYVTDEKFRQIQEEVRSKTGIDYDEKTAGLFLKTFATPESIKLDIEHLNEQLWRVLPDVVLNYSAEEIIRMSTIFSRIIDYKSSFTCSHSVGIAKKAMEMGKYYGWDTDMQAKLYIAGSLHDIGKLMIQTKVLEKPGKLTDEEYNHIQNHAYGTYLALSKIRGIEDIASWAYLHHEKLDGSGYPFGRKGDTLGERKIDRLSGYLSGTGRTTTL